MQVLLAKQRREQGLCTAGWLHSPTLKPSTFQWACGGIEAHAQSERQFSKCILVRILFSMFSQTLAGSIFLRGKFSYKFNAKIGVRTMESRCFIRATFSCRSEMVQMLPRMRSAHAKYVEPMGFNCISWVSLENTSVKSCHNPKPRHKPTSLSRFQRNKLVIKLS